MIFLKRTEKIRDVNYYVLLMLLTKRTTLLALNYSLCVYSQEGTIVYYDTSEKSNSFVHECDRLTSERIIFVKSAVLCVEFCLIVLLT